MTRELLLLRHAKSAWDPGVAADFDRPLSGRGKRDAPRVGRWLRTRGLDPDLVMSSPARRAMKTAHRVCQELGYGAEAIVWDRRIYEARLADLLAVLADCPGDRNRVLLVGHNPGFEDLLTHLLGEAVPAPADGKLLPTATVARLEMPDDWSQLAWGAARLLDLTRPGELPEPPLAEA